MGRKLRFEWDKGNLEHIAIHGVTAREVEQVFRRPTWEFTTDRDGEPRHRATGKTDAGRYLTVVYTMRAGKCAL
jgi:uncharacterized DUF497 family protein